MTPIDILDIKLSDIDIPEDRARDLDDDWVLGLAAIIARQGLTNPITVRQIGERFRLVTGLRRLEALRLNGRNSIPARLSNAKDDNEARLEEVMENLGRDELNALDRCHHLYELKQVWQKLHPEATHGGDRKSDEIKSQKLALDLDAPEFFGFAKATAEKIGLSQSAIKLGVKIWTDLTPASRVRLSGTALARKQSELKLLSAQSAPIQKKLLELILAETATVDTVQGALDLLENGSATSAIEKQFDAFSERLKKLPDGDFDRLLIAHEERVIASLKRRGRI